MADHDALAELRQSLAEGGISRRQFLHRALMLGLSVGAAQALAACQPAPGPTATASPQPTPSATATTAAASGRATIATPSITPTIVPPTPRWRFPTPESRPSPTPTPVMWQPAQWSCPGCEERFSDEYDLVQHFLTQHARKIPGVQQVSEPTYARFVVNDVPRFDQHNTVFSRVMWDSRYQEQLALVKPRPRPPLETPEDVIDGRALVAGAIYVDDKAGMVHPNYGGYSGRVLGVDGLYSWDEPVGQQQLPADDPAVMTERIKWAARFYGADLVGVCEVDPRWVYSHYYDRETGAYGEINLPYKYAVVMAIEMKWVGIDNSPGFPASAATALAYSGMPQVSSSLARYIRGLGYEAVPSGNDTTQNIPLAIDAGLGEIGRMGLLLTPEFGPRQRICKVLTNLPLVPDKPVDFGMQRFCENCFVCAHNCPVRAVPYGDRDETPTSISNRTGIRRWTVNVTNCYLFWRANGVDCSNCVMSCPWGLPRRTWL